MDPIIVIGGGMAGLSAAARLASEGRKVILLERSAYLGGRARSDREAGFAKNLGPHALYRGLDAERILGQLGVDYTAPRVDNRGTFFAEQQQRFPIPDGPVSLLANGKLGPGGKLGLAKAFGVLALARPEAHAQETVTEWLHEHVPAPVRSWMAALIRVATYTDLPDRQSAEIALHQLKSAAQRGVRYVDGGWQSLVDGLAEIAKKSGVEIRTNAKVVRIEHDRRVHQVRLEDGSISTSRVLLALDPRSVAALTTGLAHGIAERFASASIPIEVACLDVALKKLPDPSVKFVTELDRPTYLSVHSATAEVAPDGQALIHVAQYLRPGDHGDRAELERLLDFAQPGWRSHLVDARFLPKMTAMHRAVLAEQGSLAGRPTIDALGVEGLLLAGDWVGPKGLLLDAAMASAESAALRLLAREGQIAA
jgi:phytoene dehydrogenase-like protein